MSEHQNHTPAEAADRDDKIVRFDPPVQIPGWHPDWRIHGVAPKRQLEDSRIYVTLGPGDREPVSNTLRNLVPGDHFIGIEPSFIEDLVRRALGEAPTTNTTADDIRVTFVLFEPSALYRLHDGQLTVEFFGGAPRKRVSCTWGDLHRIFGRSLAGASVRYLANEQGEPVHYDVPGARFVVGRHPNMVKRARGAWVPGEFTGTAGHKFMADETDRFIATNLLVIDVDAGDPEALAKELEAYAVLIHSTYKHTPEHPRCRVIFLLATPCKSRRDYNKAERFIAEQLNGAGFFVPPGDSTLGRLAYLPMHAPGVDPVHIKIDGRPLDLAPILALPGPAEFPRRTATPATGTSGSALAWARRKIESCPPGRRHTTLYATAAWLAEKTAATDDEIVNFLLTAAVAVASEGEAARPKKEKCIRDGIARGRGKP